jgi:hypothetical protein
METDALGRFAPRRPDTGEIRVLLTSLKTEVVCPIALESLAVRIPVRCRRLGRVPGRVFSHLQRYILSL